MPTCAPDTPAPIPPITGQRPSSEEFAERERDLMRRDQLREEYEAGFDAPPQD